MITSACGTGTAPLDRIHHALYLKCREKAAREASPTACAPCGLADNRPRYNRDKLRYPSDLTDAEWAHIEPLIPPGKPGGGKRRVAIREVINGVMYILSTGCQWRALPKDLPPRSTPQEQIHHPRESQLIQLFKRGRRITDSSDT